MSVPISSSAMQVRPFPDKSIIVVARTDALRPPPLRRPQAPARSLTSSGCGNLS